MPLPQVTAGGPDFAEDDWTTIFSSLGMLHYDTRIAAAVRVRAGAGAGDIGLAGMESDSR